MVIRCIIINRISRVGDVGEPGYSVYGEDVPACKKSGSHDHWHGATQDNLTHVMPTCYITRSVYNFLTDSERNEIRSKVRGVCEDDCIHRISNPYYGGGQCWALNESKIITDFPYPHVPSHPFCVGGTFHQVHKYPGTDEYVVSGIVENYPYCDGDILLPTCTDGDRSACSTCPDGTEICADICVDGLWKDSGETCPPDPCEGVVCNPECVGVDRYEMVCKDGVCVRGALIEANSTECGYVKPECTEGDKKPGHVCSGGKWVPVGTPPPVPECKGDDKKAGYVCSGGKWVPVGTPPPVPECKGDDKKAGYVCSGGKWVPITTPPGVEPKYLTAAEAAERFRMGLPCYIKCVLPILDMLPGLPYTPDAWIPPLCAITTES